MDAAAAATTRGDRPHMRTLWIVGDSHTRALRDALAARTQAGAASVRIVALQRVNAKGARKFDGLVTPDEALARLGEAAPGDIVFSTANGNQHAIIGLLQHPQPFDFRVDAEDDASVPATQIPTAVMREVFDKRVRKEVQTWTAIRAMTRAPLLHVLPPPPIGDETHIRAAAGNHFRGRDIEQAGITPARIRWKLWRLQCRALEAAAAEAGIGVVRPPPDAVGDDGLLKRAFYGPDATHANALYGELVLREIEAAARAA
jgi:hypothetical protein